MKNFKTISTVFTTMIALTIVSFSAIAHEYTLGDLFIDHPTARETPPGVSVGAGYLNITNKGKKNDTLISVSGDIAPIIQIHTMTVENDTMRMQQLKEGLVIPSGKTVKLEAGGNHIMFMSLPKSLKEGEQHKVTLNFAKAGSIDVIFKVNKHQQKNTHDKHGQHQSSKKATDAIKHKHH